MIIYIVTSRDKKTCKKMGAVELKILFFYDAHKKVHQVAPFTNSLYTTAYI